jgi:hypothetical protein
MKTGAFDLVSTETLLLRSSRAGYWVARITCEPKQQRHILNRALERIDCCDEAGQSAFVVGSRA